MLLVRLCSHLLLKMKNKFSNVRGIISDSSKCKWTYSLALEVVMLSESWWWINDCLGKRSPTCLHAAGLEYTITLEGCVNCMCWRTLSFPRPGCDQWTISLFSSSFLLWSTSYLWFACCHRQRKMSFEAQHRRRRSSPLSPEEIQLPAQPCSLPIILTRSNSDSSPVFLYYRWVWAFLIFC